MRSTGTQVGIQEAAKILGMNEQTLRIGLQRGQFDIFGRAIDRSGKGKRYKYVIFRAPLMKFAEGNWTVHDVG